MQPIETTGLIGKETEIPPAASPATESLLSPSTEPLLSPTSPSRSGDAPHPSEGISPGMDSLDELLDRFGGLGPAGDEAAGERSTRRCKAGGPGLPHTCLHVPSGSSTARTLKPSTTYESVSQAPSQTIANASTLDPLILVVNLNHTLLYRAARTIKGSRRPTYRPYLSTLLEWVCEANKEGDGRRRTEVVVYPATRAHNVRTLLEGMGLLPSPSAALTSEHAPLVRLVLSREDFDLSASDYGSEHRHDQGPPSRVDKARDPGERRSEEDGVAVRRRRGRGASTIKLSRSLCAYLSKQGSKYLMANAKPQILQPFSHIPIPPFVPSLSLSSSSDDRSLLSTISLLSLLSHETNIPAFLRSGGVSLEKEGKVGEEMGRRECEERGVRVQSAFDGMWSARVLERDV